MYILTFLFWLILNGKATLEIALVGVCVSALAGVLMAVLFSYTPKTELKVLKKAPLFAAFICILVYEVVKSNLQVIGLILRGNKALEPAMVKFSSGLRTEFGKYLLANSITLTPGTISVEVSDDTFVVHCLKRSMLDFSDNNRLCRWIRKLEA